VGTEQKRQAYDREPYRRELDTEVVRIGEDGQPYAVLADTVLYPEGGGQGADHGRIDDVRVIDVQRRDGEIRHYMESKQVPAGPVTVELDWLRRYDHMQQHTAQHLLTAVADRHFGWQTTSFHLQEEVCDIELATSPIYAGQLGKLEEAVAAEIRAARPVEARRVPLEEYETLDVRSRGLPKNHQGDVRLITIDGLDVTSCGGTHLASTAEIESLKLLGTEPMRGGTRLFWTAGGRVRRRLGRHESRNAELRGVVGAADDDLVHVVRGKLAQLKDISREAKLLQGRLADAVASGLTARAEPVVDVHLESTAMDFLQQVGRRFAASDHPGVTLLTAVQSEELSFVVARGGGSRADVQKLGQRVADALGGRGGGSGTIFQGKASSARSHDDALAALTDSGRSGST
jgi:alanyl-tRNA synthetase